MPERSLIKIKIYAISISAASPINVAGEQMGFAYYHMPGLIPAESIDHAADAARQQAFERWSTSEGFEGHQAVITPITKRFCELFERAFADGVIGEGNEDTQIFKWNEE